MIVKPSPPEHISVFQLSFCVSGDHNVGSSRNVRPTRHGQVVWLLDTIILIFNGAPKLIGVVILLSNLAVIRIGPVEIGWIMRALTSQID